MRLSAIDRSEGKWLSARPTVAPGGWCCCCHCCVACCCVGWCSGGPVGAGSLDDEL